MAKFSDVLLVCADLERSLGFYCELLGLKIVRNGAPHRIELELGSGAYLQLHAGSKLLTVRPGSLQLSFAVDDVDAFVARCTSLGVPVFQDPYNESSARVAVIGDPDGYPVQITSASKKRAGK